jgi:Zn-dependent protease
LFDRVTAFVSQPARLLIVPAALLAIMLHEISHGLAAYRLGDRTAKASGRLSLNPLRHVDVIGLLALIFAGFGWAKPVPVDMRYFKKPRRDFALTALAGPASNLLQAVVGFLLFDLTCVLLPGLNAYTPMTIFYAFLTDNFQAVLELQPAAWLAVFFYYYVLLNIGLGVFNLIPIPPLDGSKIIGVIIPDRYYFPLLRYERYGMLLLFALLFTGVLDTPLGFLQVNAVTVLYRLTAWPFRLFGVAI